MRGGKRWLRGSSLLLAGTGRTAAALVLVASMSAACQGTMAHPPLHAGKVEDLPGRAAGTGFPVGVAHLYGVDGVEVVNVPSLKRSAQAAGLAPAHVDALSDGAVTLAEYERLYRDFVSCAEQRSIALDDRGPIHDEIRDLDLFVYGIPDIPGEGPPDGAVAECATRHYYAAEELYRAQHQRPLAEQEALVDKRFREQYDCYIDHGADLPFPISRVRHHQHEMLLLMDTYTACGSPYHRAGSNAPLPGDDRSRRPEATPRRSRGNRRKVRSPRRRSGVRGHDLRQFQVSRS